MDMQPNIVISREDADRLEEMLSGGGSKNAAVADMLDDELARATIVPASSLPEDVVSMNSQVVFEDLDSGQRREVTLVYPEQADVAAGRISVLTSMDSALLGLAVGQEITWPMPRGKDRRVRVLEVRRPG